MKLYELTEEKLALQAMLEDGDVDPEVLADTMEAVNGDYNDKMESYCKVIKNLEADRDAKKNEAKRLNDGAKVLDNNIERLKAAMFDSMKATNTAKVKGTLFTVAIQRNGGKAPVITPDVVDTSKLRDELVTIIEKPNIDAIRTALESGEKVDGFKLGERGESLRIK